MAKLAEALSMFYNYLHEFESTQRGKLVADAHDQQPFEPEEWGLKVILSGHFCVSLHVGHARRKQAGIKLQEYLPEAHI